MGRASSTAMDALHGTMARLLTEELVRAGHAAAQPRRIMQSYEEDGKTKEREVPNPDYSPLNPQLLDKVLKMLKDNGVDSPEKNEAIRGLAAALDDIDLEYTAAH